MNPQLQTVLQQAIQAFHGGNFFGADLILQKELQEDINSVDAIFELGIAYAKANRFLEALSVFGCLQPYKNDDVRIPYNLGLIHSIEGKHELAIQSYDQALKIQPDDVAVLINKGSSCNDVKNYVLALEVLNKAIKINPDIPQAWSNKGIALNNLNLYQESLNAYNEAIKLAPGYYEAWSNKSAPLNKLKRFDEASEACDEALRLKPDYAEAWSNKGMALHELKRYDEAIAHYDKALTLKPHYAEALTNKGMTLRELKRYDDAIAHFDKALNLKSDYPEAWSNKGVTLHELKRYDEAIVYFDRALNLRPCEASYFYQKSFTNIALNQFAIAIENLEFAIQYNYSPKGHADYVLSALKPENGLKPMPKDFVAELFDIYADSFDKHLMETLKYEAPKNLLELLNLSIEDKFDILDIGCGTGIMGKLLKPYSSRIVGVDLSKEMLARAELTGAYDQLMAEDILEFLNKCNDQFDLIVSSDVFIYIGELSNIFMGISRVIKSGGHFCFSVEKNESAPFALSPKTLRYRHSRYYIEQLASMYGFKIENFLERPIRQENYVDVDGYCFLLKRDVQ